MAILLFPGKETGKVFWANISGFSPKRRHKAQIVHIYTVD